MKGQIFDYLVKSTGALTVEDIILNFLVATVIAIVIFISYRITHSNVVYSERFNVSLILLTLVTTLVMCVIGNNIALSLGMVGALSIVRFRTPIKDTRDTTYIFWGIAVGICCGVSEYMIAAVGSAVIFLVMLVFGFIKTNDKFLFIIRGSRSNMAEAEKHMSEIFGKAARLKVRNTTLESEEYIFEVSEKILDKTKKRMDIVDYFYKNLKADSVNIVCQNEEIGR